MKKERREQGLGKLEKRRRKNIRMESLREGPEGNRKGMQQNRAEELKPKKGGLEEKRKRNSSRK